MIIDGLVLETDLYVRSTTSQLTFFAKKENIYQHLRATVRSTDLSTLLQSDLNYPLVN